MIHSSQMDPIMASFSEQSRFTFITVRIVVNSTGLEGRPVFWKLVVSIEGLTPACVLGSPLCFHTCKMEVFIISVLSIMAHVFQS